jgi:hypothetical protein
MGLAKNSNLFVDKLWKFKKCCIHFEKLILLNNCQECEQAINFNSKFTTQIKIFKLTLVTVIKNYVCYKYAHKRPGVNFINVLLAALAPVDSKSVKRYWQLDWILTLLGATGVIAVHKYRVKLSPGL